MHRISIFSDLGFICTQNALFCALNFDFFCAPFIIKTEMRAELVPRNLQTMQSFDKHLGYKFSLGHKTLPKQNKSAVLSQSMHRQWLAKRYG